MSITTFAAIDVGSSELSMKIFEISKKIGLREIDHVRHTIELGGDTYNYNKVSFTLVDELCNVLNNFNLKMKEYNVIDYTACATSALREADNCLLIVDQIKLKTGLKVKVLSNSEQRFLCYKAIALKHNTFNSIVKKGTAIVDIGAGSTQISLFNNEALVVTQNIKLGSLRIREILSDLEDKTTAYNKLLEEYINKDMSTFSNLFLNNIEIKNLIIVADYFEDILNIYTDKLKKSYTKEQFMETFNILQNASTNDICKKYGLSYEIASLAMPTALIFKKFIDDTCVDSIWFSGITLCDGIAADYAEKKDKIFPEHNFINDILASAKNIASRYNSNTKHTENVQTMALGVFDTLRKAHGLGKRERLLLQIAVILHNCGEYINMNNVHENSYNIIMSTEIIGLSHNERQLIANVVRYNMSNFPQYSVIKEFFDTENYIKISKLTAILRLANALDKSHQQKFSSIKYAYRDNELIITVDTLSDITLELGLFQKKADLFESVYGIRPILRQKRSI